MSSRDFPIFDTFDGAGMVDGSFDPNTMTYAPVPQIRIKGFPFVTSDVITLDGSKSYHPKGESLTYSWTIISEPAASDSSITNTTDAVTTVSNLSEGSYTFRLDVTDQSNNTRHTTVTTLVSVKKGSAVLQLGMGSTLDADHILSSSSSFEPVSVGQSAHLSLEMEVETSSQVPVNSSVRWGRFNSFYTTTVDETDEHFIYSTTTDGAALNWKFETEDRALVMAVDPRNEYIYYSQGLSSSPDAYIRRINFDGFQEEVGTEWPFHIDAEDTEEWVIRRLAVDSQGNVYCILADAQSSGQDDYYRTMKFDENGNEIISGQWPREFEGTEGGAQSGMVMGSGDLVYVNGALGSYNTHALNKDTGETVFTCGFVVEAVDEQYLYDMEGTGSSSRVRQFSKAKAINQGSIGDGDQEWSFSGGNTVTQVETAGDHVFAMIRDDDIDGDRLYKVDLNGNEVWSTTIEEEGIEITRGFSVNPDGMVFANVWGTDGYALLDRRGDLISIEEWIDPVPAHDVPKWSSGRYGADRGYWDNQ